MNKLSNLLTCGLILLGAVRCNAGTEAVKAPSTLSTAASSFLKRAFSPGTLIAGLGAFIITGTKKPQLDDLQVAALVCSIPTTFLETLWRVVVHDELWQVDSNQRPTQLLKLAISTYGAHILAIISGGMLRQLFNTYTKNDPQARLALTCIGALLATCADQKQPA